MELLVIDVRLKDGKGHVVLADGAHEPATEFPLEHEPASPRYRDQEQQIVEDAQAVLRAASAALDER